MRAEKEDLPLVNIEDYRDYAEEHLDTTHWLYIEDGSTEQITQWDNIAAYRRYRLIPTQLVNVSAFRPEVQLYGNRYDIPVGLSPTAFQMIANWEGEAASAKAAQAYNTVFILSASASTTIEDVATAAPNVTKWMQILLWESLGERLQFIRRAEAAGFEGIVVTVDVDVHAITYNGQRNLTSVKTENITNVNFNETNHGHREWSTWQDIVWVMENTHLKVIVKGILNPSDARKAVDIGVDGIYVSNHGGR